MVPTVMPKMVQEVFEPLQAPINARHTAVSYGHYILKNLKKDM